MSYEPRALEAALNQAVGEDSPLIAELRTAFFQSAAQHLAALSEAGGAADWHDAASRLVSLAASFGALDLLAVARAAAAEGAGEGALTRVRDAIEALDS